ncbi:PAS domain S-box protein [Desulfobacter curvatus]|uniref:PAS domain S-box protein n=1 Tax=Desulfobacter curvatus TaxID=2290 RepID=UPI0003A59555|nr:PAS domain S-box protein [Desulfobacter curvatus]
MPNSSSISDTEKLLAEYKRIEKEQLMILDALQSVNEIDDLDELIYAILTWMKKWSGCEAVGIRLQEGDDFPYYITSGFPEQFVKLEKHLCSYDKDGSLMRDDDGNPMIECMCGNVIRGRFDPSKNFFTSDGSFWSNCTTKLLSETTDADRQARTRNRCNGFGYESVALIPLRTAGETFGLMQFNDHGEGKFSAGNIATYRRVADHVASSLAKLKAVASLKKSEEQLKAIVENTQDAIGVSQNSHHLFVNTAYVNLFGYRQPEELIRKPILELIGEQERDRVKDFMIARENGGHVNNCYQTKGLKQDGTEFDMEVTVSRYGAANDRKNLVILRDITERIKTEEKMRRQKYFLEKAQEIGKIGTWELDIESNTLVWTDENYKIFGVPRETDLTYERFLDCIHPDDLEYVDNAWRAAVSGKPYDIEHRINANGTVKWVREKAKLEFDSKGKCIRGIGVTQDITQKKQKEKIQSVKLRLADYASSHTSRELLQKFLDEAESLAESEIGFYHLIDENQKTLSLQAWSTNTLKNMCTEYVKEEHYPIAEAGVWGDSFRKRKPLVYNDYQTLPHKAGLPEGHAPVIRLLTVPVLRGGNVVAILGVGNKRTNYTGQDIEIVKEVADISWEAISLKKSNETLQESEQRFRTLFEQAPIGIDLVSPEGIPTHVNKALVDLLGYSEDELCANQFITWTHPEDINNSLESVRQVREGHTDHVTVEKRYLNKKGGTIWARTEVAGVRKPSGELDYFIAMVQDITKRKFTENALKVSEERFKFLSEATVEGIYIHDNGVVLDANESFAKILGYDSANEIIGAQIMAKHLTSESLKKAQTYIASDYEGAYEVVGIKCNGTRFPVEFISRNIEYRGKLARVVAVRDITEHKAAEKLLTWNVKRNEILSETAARLLQSGNPKSLINDLCKTVMAFLDCQVFFNFMEDPDAGKLHLNACAGISDEKRSEIEWIEHGTTVCGTVAQTGRCMICENISNSSDPVTALIKSFDIQAYCCHPLVIEERLLGTLSFGKRSNSSFLPEEIEMMKSIANLVAVAVNRIKHEKEKINLEAQLREAQKVEAIGRLAGGVAHDLNNMLCPILNYAEMLTEELRVGDERREQALEIANAGARARDLVRQLLAFSRKQVITLKPTDINQVVRGIEKLLLRTIPEDIKFKKNLSREIRPVLADIGQIEQILMNLTVNSADAMPDGGFLAIETGLSSLDEEYARTHPDVRPGLYAMLSVSDTGSGMDDATLAHIFEPFFSTKGERGTGLGLATVYGIVKQHSGNIWVYSEPEMGTTFKIYFPIAMEMPDKKEPVQKTKYSQKGEETILLVEDNEQVRHLGRTILQRQGYRVLEAGNGDDALDIMTTHDDVIHLLLTDVVMPGMNGKELYEKAVQKYKDLKVLFMSGYTDDIIAHRGVLSDGIQLIQKPFSVNGLAAKVREVLDNNTAAQSQH